jgi:hypothetical protein
MHGTSTTPAISPDGRFEVIVEETPDRFEMLYDTILIERSTGERLFTCRGVPRVEFIEDGTLNVNYPGYEPGEIQIDPTRAVFRTRSSEPWVPLAAWPMVEAAFGRGWAHAMDYRVQNRQAVFPWVTVTLLLCSVAALFVLGVETRLPCDTQKVLLMVAGAAVLFFGWLAAGALRWWGQARKLARASHTR